jgi:hypothetical protein
MESSSLLLPTSPVHSEHPALSAACPFQFLVYYSVFCLFVCFLRGGNQSVQGSMLVYPRDGCESTTCCLFAHLLVCVSQTSLEPVSGGAGALRVPQHNMAWRSFVQAGGSGCQSFASSWWFFSCQVWLQHLSKVFDLWSSCCLLPSSSRHLGSSSQTDFLKNKVQSSFTVSDTLS